MHGVNLGEMPLQCLLRPHHLALRDGLLLLLSNSSDWIAVVRLIGSGGGGGCGGGMSWDEQGNLRVVSASSSFLRFILSFKVSASRRACWMRDCMASGETSFDIACCGVVVVQELG